MSKVHEIGGVASWRGPDMAARADEWTMRFDDAQRAELLAALAAIEAAGLDFLQLTRQNFVLPTVGPMLESIVGTLLDGRGFILVQGVPIEGLSERQIELMYWGMGLYVGIALPQGAAGTD